MDLPPGFVRDVERAQVVADCGLLSLLATEVDAFPWAQDGRALVAEAETAAGCEPTETATLVFSGHMVDEPGRPIPRFPPQLVPAAGRVIRAAIEEEQRRHRIHLAVASAASGGDILFLEAAQDLGIPTRILLPGPAEEFIARSVAPAGPGWIERFRSVCARSDPRILHERLELPSWLAPNVDYSLWERNNRWILATALHRGGEATTLLVLWDRQAGDGTGGTAHMVERARAEGARVIAIEPLTLVDDGD